jgi:hypothetical protein
MIKKESVFFSPQKGGTIPAGIFCEFSWCKNPAKIRGSCNKNEHFRVGEFVWNMTGILAIIALLYQGICLEYDGVLVIEPTIRD